MKNPNPFLCDQCSSPKQPSNGWFIAVLDVKADIGNAKVAIFDWSDDLADVEGVKHLCSSGCVSTFVAKATAKQ